MCFCSLFPLFIGLDRAQNTKGIEMHTNNLSVETFGFTHETDSCIQDLFGYTNVNLLNYSSKKVMDLNHIDKVIYIKQFYCAMCCRILTNSKCVRLWYK